MASQRAFSLIELTVVIAIMGTVAGITVPLVVGYLNSSREQSYNTEKAQIQTAVDAFYSAVGNTRFDSNRQYPIIGRDETNQSELTNQTTALSDIVDDGSPFDGVTAAAPTSLWNALGGTQGSTSTPAWADGDSDSVRTIGSGNTGTSDTWSTVGILSGGITYYTDPRYYFIDFDVLKSDGWLKEVPESASTDHTPSAGTTNTYDGSYIWYVDKDGKVQSLYKDFPSTTGHVRGVFP